MRRPRLTPSLAFLLPALAALVLDAALPPWASPAAGQVVEGIDIGAARSRAKAQAHDLEAFSSEVGKRGEALRQQALDTRTAAQANRARVGSVKTGGAKGAFDFDAMIAGADAAAAGSKLERPKLIVFASLSMPVPSLKTLFRDVTRAGGVVVFRGFKNGSVKDFMAGLAPAFDKGEKIDGVGIDPRLFRAFNVEAVPTYVVTAGDIELCAGFHCTTPLPPYDRLAGNVTTDYALSTIADGRGPGSAAAKVYLGKLRRNPR
ncbi:MAG: type-F conjugative transfer system pilin assembly protein TrbC [Sphingomonadaceae bacterium]|nr:type-F conjugative transfer system pilin assembly protein TrbC [Sphingomonadaceae bacterium]